MFAPNGSVPMYMNNGGNVSINSKSNYPQSFIQHVPPQMQPYPQTVSSNKTNPKERKKQDTSKQSEEHNKADPKRSSMEGLYNYQKQLLMLEKENEKAVQSAGNTPTNMPAQNSTPAFVSNNLPKKNAMSSTYSGASPLTLNSMNSPASAGTTPKTKEVFRRRPATYQQSMPAASASKKFSSEPVTPIGPITPASGNANKPILPSSLSTVTETPLENDDENNDEQASKKVSLKRPKKLKKTQPSHSMNSIPSLGSSNNTPPYIEGIMEVKQTKKNSRGRPKKGTNTVQSAKAGRIAKSAGTTPLTVDEALPESASSNEGGSNNGMFPTSVATDPTPQTDFDPMGQNDPTLSNPAYHFEDEEIFTMNSGLLDKGNQMKNQPSDQQKQQTDAQMEEPFDLDFLDPNSNMNYNDLNLLQWQ